MIQETSKFWFLKLLLSVAFIAIPLAPCSCAAHDAQTEQASTNSPHSCCDENKERTSNQSESRDCDNCLGCISNSGCSVDIEIAQVVQGSIEIDVKPAIISSIVVSHFAVGSEWQLLPPERDPPAHKAISASSLSSILQRWLI